MSDKKNNNVTVNFGGLFSTALAILFIALKLTGYINWSWFYVLMPIWIPIAIAMLIFIVVGIILLVSAIRK